MRSNRMIRVAYRYSFDLDREIGARSRYVFIPTGDENNSAEAGMHKPPPSPHDITTSQ